MKTRQEGFAVVEVVIAIVIVVGIVGAGYLAWNQHTEKSTAAAKTTKALNYLSPTTSVPATPQVSTSADLNSALQALNQTDVSSSNVDSTQLSSQAAGF